jgi:hypothetical protein
MAKKTLKTLNVGCVEKKVLFGNFKVQLKKTLSMVPFDCVIRKVKEIRKRLKTKTCIRIKEKHIL